MELLNCIRPGKIIEIQGDESTGKTKLALELVKAAQDDGGLVVYIDADHKLNPTMYTSMVDTENFYIYQSNTTQEILKILKPLAELNIISMIVIDSIGSLRSKKDSSKEVAKFLVEMSTLIAKAKASCVLINQYRFSSEGLKPMYDKIVNTYAPVRVKTEVIDEKYTSSIIKNKLRSYGLIMAL